MATRYLRNIANGLNNVTSWSSTPNGNTGSSVPATGDDVYMLELSGTITSGLNLFETNVPATITVGSRCQLSTPVGESISIGDGTNTCDTISYQGSGSRFSITAADDDAIGDVIAEPTGGIFTVVCNGDVDLVSILGGRVMISGSQKPADISLSSGYTEVSSGGTTAFVATGGQAKIESDLSSLVSNRGSTVMVQNEADITTLDNYGGNVYLQSSGTTTTANIRAGLTSIEGNKASHTITNTNLYGSPSTTRFVSKSGSSEIIFSNPIVNKGNTGVTAVDPISGVSNTFNP
jgi:hypothetical protein